MGVIFTLEQLAQDRIPSIDDYVSVKRSCKIEFQELHKLGFINGVLFYGTSPDNHDSEKKDFRIGSDIDFVTVLNFLKPQFVQRLQEFTERIGSKNVPLEFNSFTKHQVEQGLHEIEPSFFEQIKKYVSNESIVGNNPLKIFKPKQYEHNDIVGIFIDRYAANLKRLGRDAFTPKYGKNYCQYLTRLINYTLFLPVEMHFIKYHEIPTKSNKPLSKLELVDLYTSEFKDINPEPLQKTSLLWQQYSQFFEKKPYNLKSYAALLDKISNCYGTVEMFIVENMKLAKSLPKLKPVVI